MTTDIQIAYIGGGSRHWARVMMQDLALSPGLGGRLRLYDLDYARAAANVELGGVIFKHPDAVAHFEVEAFADRAAALRGADIVFVSILPGPMPCFAADLDIPARYGVVQTVGDTIGPGGLSRCLRSVPIFTDLAQAVQEHCPQAWIINYTNPMTVATQALTALTPHLKAVGCCHEVFGTRSWLGMMAARHYDIPLQHRNEVNLEVVGLNHFTFFPWARYHGHDVWPAIDAWIDSHDNYFGDKTSAALAREEKGRFGSCDGLIQLDFRRRFGVVGAAGDRHLVEFVPWYCQSREELRRWGVSITGSKQRLSGYQAENVIQVPQRPDKLTRSKEEGVDLLRALCGGTPLTTNVNVPNRGQIPWLPAGHVVETLATVGDGRITPLTISEGFPLALQAQLRQIADVQQLSLQAALDCDRDLALQALLADPLCRLPTDQAAAMLDDLIAANVAWLPEAWH